MEEDLRRTREAGFVEHLTKPVNVQHLLKVIEAVTCRRA
jgi:CheY-like chemotaxis protein